MKAILVIDEMPTTCGLCSMKMVLDDYNVSYCFKSKKELNHDNLTECRPSWCPLKEMPKKARIFQKETNERLIAKNREYYADQIGAYTDGWNDCLKELEND